LADSVEDGWAALEVAPWVGAGVRRSDLADGLQAASNRDPSLAIYRIRDGAVELESVREDVLSPDKLAFCHPRAIVLRDFLAEVVADHAIDCDIRLGVRMEDRGPEERGVPIFCFHKVRYEANILLPDLDFVFTQYYRDPGFRDLTPFADKRPEAFFVGATTGGIVTMERIAEGGHERIRAARFFADKPGVTFEISEVVQCDSPETQLYVEGLVPRPPARRSWQEQMACRYILSMDGNGVSWSRTAVGLSSNSTLVKYASAYQVYYFHGLEPWVHYIPVRRDREVLDLVAGADRTGARDARIAEAGTAFFAAHLTKERIGAYTAEVLRRYCAALD
jgi:hypothetical protein